VARAFTGAVASMLYGIDQPGCDIA